jgi:predicted RNA methylase
MRIDNEVLNVLSQAKVNGAMLTLTGQLDRALYAKTNKVLEAAGGKWNRKAAAHVFDADAAARIEDMLLTGSVEVPKDEFNFFPSPPAIVARLLELADVQAGHQVLEPSAGRGNIAIPLLDAGADLMAYELQESNVDALVKAVATHPKRGMAMVVQGDFLAVEPTPLYDRVVMNPPFLRQSDIKHVQHALQFLKPSGLLVSVMAAGTRFRDNKLATDFRTLVETRGGRIEDCPEGSFKASGTMVSTVIVTIPA